MFITLLYSSICLFEITSLVSSLIEDLIFGSHKKHNRPKEGNTFSNQIWLLD